MTARYAIREIPARRRQAAWRVGLLLLLCCTLTAAMVGCRNEASNERAPVVRAQGDSVGAGAGQPDESDDEALPAEITIDKPVLDLKEVGTDSKVSGKFVFASSGRGTLKIEKTYSCCGVVIRGLEAGQEYPPGERGTVEFEWSTGSTAEPSAEKEIRLQTNDPEHKFVSLKIKADVVRRVAFTPTKLRLFLKQENAGCEDITIRSLDGKPFSISSFRCTGDTISADVDPNRTAAEYVLKPQVDVEKLKHDIRGVISINLTHPECGNVRVFYDVLPEFTITPAHLTVFDLRPGRPLRQEVWVVGNYRGDFDIESVSSQKGYAKLVEKKKVDNHYELQIEIVAPGPNGGKEASNDHGAVAASGLNRNVLAADTLEVKIKDGDTLSIPFRGFYVTQ